MNAHNRDLASSHHLLIKDSVWAQFSRRRRNKNARGQGQGNNNNSKGGGGEGGGGNDSSDDSDKKDKCPFGSNPFCHNPTSPHTPANNSPVPPATPPAFQPVQHTQTPDLFSNIPVVDNSPSTAQAPANAATGSPTVPVDSQSPSSPTASPNPVGVQASGGSNSGSASTSLDQSGLPFGADPTSFTSSGAGPNNTAPATLNSATSKGTDVGAIVGGIVGTISLVLLLLIGIWFIRRRHKNRTAPSSEFLTGGRIPFSGSVNFQFRRIDDSNYDAQSRNTHTNTLPTTNSPMSPKSDLHMRERSEP